MVIFVWILAYEITFIPKINKINAYFFPQTSLHKVLEKCKRQTFVSLDITSNIFSCLAINLLLPFYVKKCTISSLPPTTVCVIVWGELLYIYRPKSDSNPLWKTGVNLWRKNLYSPPCIMAFADTHWCNNKVPIIKISLEWYNNFQFESEDSFGR